MATEQLKKSNGKRLFGIGLLVGLSFGVLGTVTGTYAWYEYNNRAGLMYYGTAVGDSDGLEAGLVSESILEGFAKETGLTEDVTSLSGKVIYWAEPGQGLSSSAILNFEGRYGHAGNRIYATSSGSFAPGDELIVKRSPSFKSTEEILPANKYSYTYIPMAFKIAGHEEAGNQVTLNSLSLRCENDIASSVRVCFVDKNEPSSSFILRPADSTDGKTDVGGLLNLNIESRKDDYYDYNETTETEHLYGEIESYEYSEERYDGHKDYEHDQVTTFKANHLKDLHKVTYVAKTAQYYGRNSILGSKVIATSEAGGIAFMDATIFIEGWDYTCIDSNAYSSYDLKLEFVMRLTE